MRVRIIVINPSFELDPANVTATSVHLSASNQFLNLLNSFSVAFKDLNAFRQGFESGSAFKHFLSASKESAGIERPWSRNKEEMREIRNWR